MQFCVTHIYLIHNGLFTKNYIREVVRIMVLMAVDYPIICGPCTKINILLFSGNKNNVINCHLLFVLDCRRSHNVFL